MSHLLLANSGTLQALVIVAILLGALTLTFSFLAFLWAKKKPAPTPHGSADSEILRDLANRQKYSADLTLQAVNNASQSQKEKMADVERRVFESAQSTERRLLESTQATEQRLTNMQKQLDASLRYLSESNQRAIAEMRGVVDEKLDKTLETRLAKSFEVISSRLEAVYKGIGEVNALAEGVSDIRKIFAGVKQRGVWGERNLELLLSQILAPDQFKAQVPVRPNSDERVDFAVLIPGKDGKQTLLPIDSKFPLEEYHRFLDSADTLDVTAREKAEKGLLTRLKNEGKSIAEKYIVLPYTTDFALMYLPSEGLYAEAAKHADLTEFLLSKRVMLAGPGTLAALLTSLSAGFKSVAIEKRSAELWQLLAAFKEEFMKFTDILSRTQKKLVEAQNTIAQAATRTRVIGKKLSSVQGLPGGDPLELEEPTVEPLSLFGEE